jgi:uncharacterized protein (DUF3820 family)
MKLTFGKWGGQPLECIPTDYLTWVLEGDHNLEISDRLAQEIKNVLDLREGKGVVRRKGNP